MSTHQSARRGLGSRRLAAGLVALGLVSTACRAEIDGYWSGTIGEERLFLSLEQAGSVIEGEVCVDGQCDDHARGEVVEERLELSFGCQHCEGLAATTLDLSVADDRMDGLAYVPDCPCSEEAESEEESCECVFPVTLTRACCYEP